ncbi:trypsin-like peptidase domain-containing protein [Actinoplanes flavus]|uniref:Trypsin-like peptidase domain-containing protein n=1 Tax=Actinoplanes flavus TaxID=2820290 RepID=A0ABS3UCD4_9ACTN|nr:trypsin-like peptidase domain-containing protein [Actinoplanes flavus]MBO3736435.1 trypsin-like peptidase domain-containing protein [Actinoplanes flavus]
MNENETNPQTADAAADHSSTERVASEQPTLAQPPVAPQSGAPQSAAPQQHSAWAQSPWQQPQPVSAQPVSTQPVSAQPGPVPHGHPHYGYQSPQPGYQDYAQQQSAYQAWHAAQAAQAAQAAAGDGTVPPGWVTAHPAAAPRRPGSGRKVLLAGAAALLIALTAGGVGAATALALDGGNAVNTVQSGNSSVTRVVDRSSLAQIAAAVQDSVVSITTGSGEGSGVVLTADGYIVTNNHVVSTAQGSNVTVIFADGTKTQATVVGTDERTDLAVIKATGVSDLKAATFGDSAQIQVGDTVLALGSPLGLEGSVTAGIISAKDRTIQSGGEEQQSPFGGQQQQQQQSGTTTMTGLLQTDAPINPGNSGGALVNTNGEVIGINSAIATSGSSTGNIGLGFAIPSNKAKQVAEALMQGKKVSHPALGVSVTDAENGGALISNVTSGSAADKAGLQTGDVVTAADGKAIDDSDDLVAAVQAGAVGQKMTLNFTRNGSKQTVTVTLQETQ